MRTYPTGIYWSIAPLYLEQLRKWNPLATVDAAAIQAVAAVPLQVDKGVALIRIAGVMDKSPSLFMALFGGTSTALVGQAVRQAANDASVKAIVLSIDSPGGSVDGLPELADEVARAKAAKPVLAQVDGTAASAAYYVASQAGQVFAGRMDHVGSIGTVVQGYDFSKKFEADGIEAVNISSGDYKGMGMEGAELTAEHRALLQRIVDAHAADFRAMVKRGRPQVDIDAVSDGRVYLAQEALANGLIDGIQTIDQTIAQALDVRTTNLGARADALIALSRAESRTPAETGHIAGPA